MTAPDPSTRRPRLPAATAAIRVAVRDALAPFAAGRTDDATAPAGDPIVLVALSGGADSLALLAATAFEAPRIGLRVVAAVIDHGLQPGSDAIAARAAEQARALGADARIERVQVDDASASGPEAAARDARYAALGAIAAELGAVAVLTGHTLDDQAETVLLGLARGSGATSLDGMASTTRPWGGRGADLVRPLLALERATTASACVEAGLQPWHDPHNDDPSYARVRVRRSVLPVLERELGPGVARALARTAEQLREDADALDHLALEVAEDLAEHAEAGIALPVAALMSNPPALRHRLIRLAVRAEFHVALTRAQTLEVARLVTDWRGQGPVHLPGVRASREAGSIVFSAAS